MNQFAALDDQYNSYKREVGQVEGVEEPTPLVHKVPPGEPFPVEALGPLKDVMGTPFFSFGSENAPDHRENDLLLIRALYQSQAGPGGDPETVLRLFNRLLHLPK